MHSCHTQWNKKSLFWPKGLRLIASRPTSFYMYSLFSSCSATPPCWKDFTSESLHLLFPLSRMIFIQMSTWFALLFLLVFVSLSEKTSLPVLLKVAPLPCFIFLYIFIYCLCLPVECKIYVERNVAWFVFYRPRVSNVLAYWVNI